MVTMTSLPENYSAIVFGSTGGIGAGFMRHLNNDPRCGRVIGFSRSTTPAIDLMDETSLQEAASTVAGDIHLVVDATGFLSNETIKPEKALKQINPENFHTSLAVNAVGPALLIKHFSHLLPRQQPGIFATLSARVGSITDNRLGGWYSYRASKAALNMIVKCAAIEISRTRPQSVFAALHPGTVETPLSEPFFGNRDRLTSLDASGQLLSVLNGLTPDNSGSFWDYAGNQLEW